MLSGDPKFAIRVSVPMDQVTGIKDALKDQCTIGSYREFSIPEVKFPSLGC